MVCVVRLCQVADRSSQKYVFHSDAGDIWKKDLYERGILRKNEVAYVWNFARSDCFSPSIESKAKLIDTLIKLLIELDVLFEHSGLKPIREEYYLVPEVWTRRHKDLDGEKCTDAQQDLATYNPRQHVTIGRRIKVVKGKWLPPILFPRFICKCANVLSGEEYWMDGKITLGMDSLRWESASWPAGQGALALWLQRERIQQVVFKVAGLGSERERVRGMYREVGGLLDEMLKEERVCKTWQQLGMRPLSEDPGVGIEWIREEELESWRDHPQNNNEAFSRRWGVQASGMLYYFGQGGGGSLFEPNLNKELYLRRGADDPEYVLHHGHADSECPPECESKIEEFEDAAKGDRASSSSNDSNMALPQEEEIDGRIRIMNLAQVCGIESVRQVPLRLYVCHPLRNLYFEADRFHSLLFGDFCAEMMRLFEALRAKKVKISISSNFKSSGKTKDILDAHLGTREVSGDRDQGGEKMVTWVQPFPRPSKSAGKTYRVDEQIWFFLDDSISFLSLSHYGFDFDQARDTLLDMKKHRMKSRQFDEREFKVSCIQMDNSNSHLGLMHVLSADKDRAKVEVTSYSFKYEVEGYEWSDEEGWV